MVSAKDRERLRHILSAISAIEEYTSGFSKDAWKSEAMRYDATLRQLEIVGEASNHLSAELTDLHSNIPWHSVAGFRNIVSMNISGLMNTSFGTLFSTTFHY